VVSATRSVRIVISGEHPIFREGLRRLLESEGGFVVEGESAIGAATLALVDRLRPDILLVGLVGSASRGLEMLEALALTTPAPRTIVLTDAVNTPEVARAVQLGVRGVVLTDSAPGVLIDSILSVVADRDWIGAEPAAGPMSGLRKLEDDQRRTKAFGLTRRELEILRHVVAGCTNKEIADRTGISENTVKSHLTSIFNKLGASNRVELALFAAHHRLLGPR
jgi:DNA-binding NarL/FixJ family response regulator